MPINRRKFLAGATATALGLAATKALAGGTRGGSAPVGLPINPVVHWRCIASWPKDLDTLMGGAVTVAERVKEMSGGRFTIEIFEDGALNKNEDLLDAVSKGLVQCGHTASDYFLDRNKALAFATSAPFGLSANEQYAWLTRGGGWQLIQELYDNYNIQYFPAGNTGPQMGGWFKKEINSVSDLAGLKMRIGGIGAEVVKRWGVEPTSVPYLQLAAALQDGRLDAAEFVGPYDDEKLGLQDQAPYYYAPGWWQYGDQLDLLVNKDAYNALPSQYQQILLAAAIDANSSVLADYDARNGAALARLVAGGTQLRQFPQEMLEEGYRTMEDIHRQNAAANPAYAKILRNWQAFRNEVGGWHRYVETPMMNFQRPQ